MVISCYLTEKEDEIFLNDKNNSTRKNKTMLFKKKKQIPNHKKNKRSLHRQNIKMPLIFYRFKLQNIKKE